MGQDRDNMTVTKLRRKTHCMDTTRALKLRGVKREAPSMANLMILTLLMLKWRRIGAI